MTKKQLLVVVVVVAAAVLAYFMWVKKDDTGRVNTMGGPSAPASGGAVTYMCEGNKTFSLSYVDANTVRLTGAGASVSLDKNAAGYWVNADGKTSVKTVGNYVVLVQNDLVTRDRCAVK